MHLVDAQLAAPPPRRWSRLSPVSITTRSPSACSCAIASARRVLDRIGDAEQARQPAVDGDEHHRLALARAAPRRARPTAAASTPSSSSSARVAERDRAARRPCPSTPLPGQRLERPSPSPSGTPRSARAATIAAASGCSLPRSRLAASRSSSASSASPAATTDDEPRLALGQRARSCRRPACRPCASTSSASAFLISTPGRRAAAGRHHDRHRRRQAQRARAGDDQHRHRVDQRVRQPRLGPDSRPDDERDDGDRDDRRARSTPATTSASRWIGARLRCASPTMRTICASSVSAPTRSARITQRAGAVDGARR